MSDFTNIEKGFFVLLLLVAVGVGIYYLLRYLGVGVIKGCTDTTATNFVTGATEDDGSCIYKCSKDTMGTFKIKAIDGILNTTIITTNLPVVGKPTKLCIDTLNGQFKYDIKSILATKITLADGQTFDSSIKPGDSIDIHE